MPSSNPGELRVLSSSLCAWPASFTVNKFIQTNFTFRVAFPECVAGFVRTILYITQLLCFGVLDTI